MTDDIVTRLRALAEESKEPETYLSECGFLAHVDWYDKVEPLQNALREAADRIQTLEWHLNDRTEGAQLIAAERDSLKAKLAEAEASIGRLRDALLTCAEAIEQPEIRDPKAVPKHSWTPTPAYVALKNAAVDARKILGSKP